MTPKHKEVDEIDELDDGEGNYSSSANEESGEFIKFRKDSLWKYSTFVLLAVVIIGGFFMFKGNVGNSIGGNVIANPQEQQPGVGGKVEVSVDDDAFIGKENAPVTVIEFSDYECPFCGRFYDQTLPQIKSEYIDKGKVKLVYRDFPLSFHPNAQKAAEAAECAGEQGGDEVYYKMHDKLFVQGVAGGVASFKQYAQEIGIDTGKFNSCLDSGKMASEVQKDFNDGQSYGVQGTPAFFVNGKLISGAQPFSAFQQVIEGEL